jgi:hypothetical protein
MFIYTWFETVGSSTEFLFEPVPGLSESAFERSAHER